MSMNSRSPLSWSRLREVLTGITSPGPNTLAAHHLHDAIVQQSRQTEFYSELGVPDSIDGRFDLLLLHAFMVLRGLERHGEAGHQLAQKTVDVMFLALDEAVRELGVGDMGVPRRVKAMSSAYTGRAKAYATAVESGSAAVTEALKRNLYRGAVVDTRQVEAITQYVLAELERLETLPFDDFLRGDLGFTPPRKGDGQ
jgi:cytochrome b pre-mRNA-processing protein 3